jgi:hypothetical protein
MCGDENPLPCYPSREPKGKDIRIILANFTSRAPSVVPAVQPVSDEISEGVKYIAGSNPAARPQPDAGTYTLNAKYSGYATVIITKPANSTIITSVFMECNDYSDDGLIFLNGFENVTGTTQSPTLNSIDWFSDLVQTGPGLEASEKTSSDGFHLELDVLTNIFDARGTITTTINDKVYEQPNNGA